MEDNYALGHGGATASAGRDIVLYNFSVRMWEQLIHFHIMQLMDSLSLWEGPRPHLFNLTVVMRTCYDPISRSAVFLGDTSDMMSTSIAQSLASKTSTQVFVSYNLQNTENRIKEETGFSREALAKAVEKTGITCKTDILKKWTGFYHLCIKEEEKKKKEKGEEEKEEKGKEEKEKKNASNFHS
uniref:Uncharacterized protein n=1 Tax=Catagonus wagneri TaxID=51154 RepID=A0A8C3VSW9_9CETA